MDNVSKCSDIEEVEIDGISGISFSIIMNVEGYGERTLKLYSVLFNKMHYNFGFTHVLENSNEALNYEENIISSITFNKQTTEASTEEIVKSTTKNNTIDTNKKENETKAVENASNSRTVYVTPTGKKYHYSSTCNGGNYSATTLDKALASGLTPCKKCT